MSLRTNSLFLLLSVLIQSAAFSATFVVNSTADTPDPDLLDDLCNDGGICTLRAAIEQANATPGKDVILFNIGGAGPHVIQVGGDGLPLIFEDIDIDGSSQVGYSWENPQIVIDGVNANLGSVGIDLATDNSLVRGLSVINFLENAAGDRGFGIRITGGGNGNTIAGNFVGLGPDGTSANPNFVGIKLEIFATNNTIGGTTANDRNVVSGNSETGIHIDLSLFNFVTGNYVGVDKSGMNSVPNLFGVVVSESASNTIGGGAVAERNIISGNAIGGIDVIDSSPTIQGNYIGLSALGTMQVDINGNPTLPNQYGIYLHSSTTNTVVGGLTLGAANYISGNLDMGIEIEGNQNSIFGNYIGLEANGTTPAGNLNSGIVISGGSDNVIGGISSLETNTIAHNGIDGISVSEFFGTIPANNRIQRNLIFGNAGLGIDLGAGTPGTHGKTDNDPGDPDTGPNNFQNFADVSGVTYDGGTNTLSLSYSVDSNPINANFPLTVEFYVDDGNGQSRSYIGSDTYTANDFLNGPAKPLVINPNGVMTAADQVVNIVLDADGNSSEIGFDDVLPADDVNFWGKKAGDQVRLNWVFSASEPLDYTVERAYSGSLFETIKVVDAGYGAGHLYEAFDQNPLPGENLYRLRWKEIDGSITYSAIAEVFFGFFNEMDSYYDPIQDQLVVRLDVVKDQELPLRLVDLSGKLVHQWPSNLRKGENTLYLDMQSVTQGLYLLQAPEIRTTNKVVKR